MVLCTALAMEAYDHTEEVIAWLVIVGCVASVLIMFLCFIGTMMPYEACCRLRGYLSSVRKSSRRRVGVTEVEMPILGENDNQVDHADAFTIALN